MIKKKERKKERKKRSLDTGTRETLTTAAAAAVEANPSTISSYFHAWRSKATLYSCRFERAIHEKEKEMHFQRRNDSPDFYDKICLQSYAFKSKQSFVTVPARTPPRGNQSAGSAAAAEKTKIKFQ